MTLPVVDTTLARRLVRSEAAHMTSLLSALQRHYGAGADIHIRRFGEAVALCCPTIPDPLLNRVLGLGPEDRGRLDEILAWYAERGVSARVDVVPHFADAAFLAVLSARGLRPVGFYTTLYGPADVALLPETSVRTRQVSGDGLNEWARVFAEVNGGAEHPDALRESVRVQYDQPEWHCYLADVGGQPAAIGALYVHEGAGVLISGATSPPFRRRGCQMALLRRRIARAAELGCDLVASYTEVGTTSQHNMERAGLRVAYTKTEWAHEAAPKTQW